MIGISHESLLDQTSRIGLKLPNSWSNMRCLLAAVRGDEESIVGRTGELEVWLLLVVRDAAD